MQSSLSAGYGVGVHLGWTSEDSMSLGMQGGPGHSAPAKKIYRERKWSNHCIPDTSTQILDSHWDLTAVLESSTRVELGGSLFNLQCILQSPYFPSSYKNANEHAISKRQPWQQISDSNKQQQDLHNS